MRWNATDQYSAMNHSSKNILSLYRYIITFGRVSTWCGWLDHECLYISSFCSYVFSDICFSQHITHIEWENKNKNGYRGPQHLIDCPGSPVKHSVYLWWVF